MKQLELLIYTMIYIKSRKKLKQENFYHGLMLGLMVHLTGEYQVESNREYGEGRPDMLILPLDKKGTAFVFAFKARPHFPDPGMCEIHN